MDQIGSDLKKILMAGIGAVSVSVEKAQEIINTLAQKGEITFEQAKALSEDAAAKLKKAINDSEIKNAFVGKPTPETVIHDLKTLSPEGFAIVKKAIAEMDAGCGDTPQDNPDFE